MRLHDPLTSHFRLNDAQKSALGKLGVRTVQDLLFYFPFRFERGGEDASVAGLQAGMDASLVGTLEKMETKKSWKRRVPISEGYLRDSTGRVKLMWFNQPYIAKMWQDGALVQAVGKVAGKDGKIYLANPQLQRISATEAGLFTHEREDESETPRLFAVYPESRGITSLWFRHAIEKALTKEAIEQVDDPIPQELLKRYNLPTLRTALVWIHRPEKLAEAEAARKRFAFEEIFFIQLAHQRERQAQAREKSFVIDVPKKEVHEFMSHFPFTATPAQMSAVAAILGDIERGRPMSRLLEGDVGSGKTAVAATAAYATVRTRPADQDFGTLQVAYMAPTEILAKQHFESFIAYFTAFPISIGLITGSGCYKFPSKVARGKPTTISRAQLLKWVASGEISILIGTHALIETSVAFKHLALVIIDEQHRFGANQRRKLAQKSATRGESRPSLPHLLSMTATPIPRTLALTIYGNLDLTLLDQMPPGRKPIITNIVKPDERKAAYAHFRSELQAGRQAYVICPRIDEPDPEKAFALMAKSVTAEAKRLAKDVFPEYRIAILHSKMTPKEKDDTMARFAAHTVDILVATSVVEVGVNVPNATLIFIEGAERFGLSQLHQLRGRVVRSSHQAYCYVCPETRGETTMARLKALVTAKNGFELAEQDLLQRGPGELSGRNTVHGVSIKQWGISDMGMEALKNLKLVEAARTEAHVLVADGRIEEHPLLLAQLESRASSLHFE
jgi:ATP-dependent DNA helicase RecG